MNQQITVGEAFVVGGMLQFKESGMALPSVDQIERAYIDLLLRKTKNKMLTASIIGCTPKTLYNKLHRYGLAEKYVRIPEA